jgi:DNA repair exonuclease SbcCD nuclease subunit
MFHRGLLHTNATGNTDHDPYAPCSLEELVAKGYDYWALGHVHEFDVLHERPHVVYSGNAQGRHAREQGPKGCVLVRVEDTEVTGYEFRHTDVLRWFRVPIVLGTDDGLDELVDLARLRLREIAQQADRRLAAVRIEISGRCGAHRGLVREPSRQEMLAQLRSLPGELTDDLWVEKISWQPRFPWIATR